MQEKGEQTMYNKGLALAIKKELDAQKGYALLPASCYHGYARVAVSCMCARVTG